MTGSDIAFVILIFAGVFTACGFAYLWMKARDRAAEFDRQRRDSEAQQQALSTRLMQTDANLKKAVNAFNRLRDQSREKLKQAVDYGKYWKERFDRIAHWESAEDAAGKAREIQARVKDLERTAEALQNAIEGYGSRYVLPPHSVLDDLAKEAGHKEAGQRLKAARDLSRQMVRKGEAITCDEQDPERRGLIEGFVLDAFNGKIEGIMEGVKSDNIGTLIQEVNDAFLLVNRQSKIFGNARIQKPYLKARLDELRWASLVQQYKKDEREEQRRVKERMREEAIVRREAERADRESKAQAEAAKARAEEIARAQQVARLEMSAAHQKELEDQAVRLAAASAERRAAEEAALRAKHATELDMQKAEYEGRISEQAALLQEALARGQRALSQAQQVKRGHVYIISNEGSFGEGVYKIGQTRRGAVDDARKQERIDELGDASVPFEFDVHAWLPSDNAPQLEQQLHARFVLSQVNKMNWRKEFFRVPLAEIRKAVEEMGLKVEWTMAAEAREYRETLKLEEQMAADPVSRDRWVQEQLGIEAEESNVEVIEEAVDEVA